MDEQRRYPKASARFIRKWFVEHVAKKREVEEVKRVEGGDVYDTPEDCPSEGSIDVPSPTLHDIVTQRSITPEKEDMIEVGSKFVPIANGGKDGVAEKGLRGSSF
jgi:hypothetical protein